MSKIIAIANQKGGVGKTTTSINLADALGILEKKVLLIDLDPQANATSGVGVESDHIKLSSLNLFDKKPLTKNCIISLENSLFDFIPATISLAAAEMAHTSSIDLFSLKKALYQIDDLYDYILIDCSPSFGLITLNALTAANSVIIPVQCEFYAMEGLSKLLRSIKSIRKSSNPNIDIEGLLITMFDSRLKISNQLKDELTKHFGTMVFESVIHRNVKLSEAPSYGMSILKYNLNSIGAENYLNLGTEIVNKNDMENEESGLGKDLAKILDQNTEDVDYILNLSKLKNNKSTQPKDDNDYSHLIGLKKNQINDVLGFSYNDPHSNTWMYRTTKSFSLIKKNYLYLHFEDNKIKDYKLTTFKMNTP